MSEEKRPYIANKQADAKARFWGVIVFLFGLCLAYLVWPDGITDTTLGAIKFGMLLRALGAAFIAFGFLAIAIVVFWL